MKIGYGEGRTSFGPGVAIELTGDEVATAIDAYLVSHGVCIRGSRTVLVNYEPCESGFVYVDSSGFVIKNGEKLSGSGPGHETVEILRPKDIGHCVEGERHCVCGGDTPRVRAGCANWRTD